VVTCQPPGATRKGVSTAESWRAVQRVLTGGLYPPTPRTPRAEGLLVVLLAATVAVFRVPLGQIDSIWAEDGVVFLRQAEESAALSPVFRPYSGYLHVVPRLVAELASWLPLTLASYVFSIAAALVVGTAAGSVWVFGRAHLPSPWLRGGLSAAVALVPAGGLEAVDNVANSHWFLVFAAFWALLARRTSAWGQVVPAVIVALAALSDPLAIVLLPLALGRLLLPRRDWWVGASYVSAMIVQLLVVFSAERTTGGRPAAVNIAFGYSMRVVSTSLVGNGTTERLVAAGGRGLIWAFAGSVAVALAAAVLLTGRRRVLIVTAAVASVGLFGVESLFALNVQYPPAGKAATDLYFGSRYTIVPALLLLSALAVAAEGIAERLAGRWRMVVLVGALAPIALVAVADYRADDGPRASAPDWSGSVERAVRDCTAAPPDQVELLPIAPTEPWAVELRCAMLTGDRARPSP
jgi:hypothetical protein